MTEKMMYGYTYEQWTDPARLLEKAQREWEEFHLLKDMFDEVAPKDHWKGPISAVIRAEDQELCVRAITHFAGGRGIKFTPVPGDPEYVRVTAPGYWGNGF